MYKAIKEIERVSKGKSFIQVDSYKNIEQKNIYELGITAKFYTYTMNGKKFSKNQDILVCIIGPLYKFMKKLVCQNLIQISLN